MVNQFVTTKCHLPPARPNSVPRARLGERLQGGLLTGRFLLALDDYHKIPQPLIHDLLNRLLEHLPPPATCCSSAAKTRHCPCPACGCATS